MGGFGTVPLFGLFSSNFLHMRLKALKMASVGPVTVTILSGQEPSDMLILAPLSSLNFFILSPFFPMILPTSFPCIINLIVRVTEGPSLGKVLFSAMVVVVVASNIVGCGSGTGPG